MQKMKQIISLMYNVSKKKKKLYKSKWGKTDFYACA